MPTEHQLLIKVLAYGKYCRMQFKYPPWTSQGNSISIMEFCNHPEKGWSSEPKTICITMYPRFGHIYSEMRKENKLAFRNYIIYLQTKKE